jgi:hypothetical protein
MGRTLRRARLTILIGATAFGTVSAVHAYTAEQQQLCSDDAMRLCSSEVPDVDRITTCMRRQYAALSKGCKSVFRTGNSEARATPKK